jgi:hypothetical protein
MSVYWRGKDAIAGELAKPPGAAEQREPGGTSSFSTAHASERLPRLIASGSRSVLSANGDANWKRQQTVSQSGFGRGYSNLQQMSGYRV